MAHTYKNKREYQNKNKDILNDIPKCKTARPIGAKNIEEKIIQSGDISFVNMDKTDFKYHSKLILTTKLNQNIDENVNIYTKAKRMSRVRKIF